MLYYIGSLIINSFGPARLLQSYTVLIGLSLFVGYYLSNYKYENIPNSLICEFKLLDGTTYTGLGEITLSLGYQISTYTVISRLMANNKIVCN